ncbi:MAG: sel1 repeat family protein [Lentisphaeria bacterium]|nr:sel1 repeat family protein [Lentisphaeria bacterium]NQZ70460.1 sel1 repeat family protein [Lentisphaeria bacterium]
MKYIIYAMLVTTILSAQDPVNTAEEHIEGQTHVYNALLRLAKQDDPAAQVDVGRAFLLGQYGLEKSGKEALKWLAKASMKRKNESGEMSVGDPRSLVWLGMCYDGYFPDLVIKENPNKAIEYFHMALEYKLRKAHYYLAYAYKQRGRKTMAAEHFKEAARLGIKKCQLEYGKILLNGIGVKTDPVKALPYLVNASDKGSTEAQMMLVDCYAGKYKGIKRDDKKMVEQLWEASKTNYDAMAKVAYLLEHGIHLNKDLMLSIRWYTKASLLGSQEAQMRMAYFFSNGIGVKRNQKEALKLYTLVSMNRRNTKLAAQANYNLALAYFVGKGIEVDNKTAFDFFKKSSELVPSANTFYNIGNFYEVGIAYEKGKKIKDIKKALLYYEKAEKLGDGRASTRLIRAYATGDIVKKDINKASEILKKNMKNISQKDLQDLLKLFEKK